MREYVHLHRKALASWVFEDPRRWHLFSFLLMKADERGRVEVSVNSYCSTYHLPRTTVLRLIEEMESRGILGQKTDNKRTIVTLCKYEVYNTSTATMWTTNGQQTDNKARIQEEEKEEMTKERTKERSKEEKEEEECKERGRFALRKEERTVRFISNSSLEERRSRFWEEIKTYVNARHPEYPREAVHSFYLFWTQTVQIPNGFGGATTLFAFEDERRWSLAHRLKSYIKHGDWLNQMREARLNSARGLKAKNKQQLDIEERQRLAREIDRQEAAERERERDERARRAAPPPDHNFEELVRSWKEGEN